MKFYTPLIIIAICLLLSQFINCNAPDKDLSEIPIADFTSSPSIAGCSQQIQFDAGTSSHQSQSYSIIKYEWDFDYNGVFNADNIGVIVFHTFNTPGTLGPHIIALQVTDNNPTPNIDITTAEITINFTNNKPVADPGGPYNITRYNDGTIDTVHLNASASYDPDDPCDEVSQYKWDTDGDGLYGADDIDGTPWSLNTDMTGESADIVNATWMSGETKTISLIVVDYYGMGSNVGETTVVVVGE